VTFHSHESLTFIDPITLQPIPYSTGSTSNTWVNPNSKNSGPSHNQPSVMLTSSTSQGNGRAGTTWIPDSRASFHVTRDSQNIKQFTHFDGPDQIFMGNGEGLSISNTGSASFISPNDIGITFKLHKLLHVPSNSKNLLSVSQFAKDDSVFFEFHPHVCLVKSQETNKILLKGVVGADGLYSFHNPKLQESSSLMVSAVSSVASPSSALTINNNSSTVMSDFVSSSLSIANL